MIITLTSDEYINTVEEFLLRAKFERWGANAWVRCSGPDAIDAGDGGTCYDTAWALDTIGLHDEANCVRELLPELLA